MKIWIVKIVTCFIIGSILFYMVFSLLKEKPLDVPLISPIVQSILEIPTQTQQTPTALKNVVDSSLQGATGTYGIAIIDLKNNQRYMVNEERKFDTASLYKLWVMAAVFERIQRGQLKEETILSQEVTVLNEKFGIASESAELTEGAVTVTVKEALEEMITVSDNYTALLLTEYIGLSQVTAFLQKNGLMQSSLGIKGEAPLTTASDIAFFYEKLYHGELANDVYTKRMIDLLKQQRLRNKLPQGLPEKTVIAHKTGELGEFTHDAGIVYLSEREYIIVVLFQSKSRVKADERIVMISQAVYRYFEKER